MRIKKLLISLLIIAVTVFSCVPAGAVKLKDIKKNYDFHYGIDVSTWNDSLKINEIKKADVEFAIIRIGYYTNSGGHLDVRFKENVKKCVEHGIEFGVYVYSYVYKASDNLKCAKWVHKELKKMGNYCKNPKIIPVAYDIEDKTQINALKKKKISKTNLYKSVCKFCDTVEDYGYIPVVYSFQGFFQQYLNITKLQSKGYKIWYAQWPYLYHLDTTEEKEMYNGTIADVWQFSDLLTIYGRRFDTNVCYEDFYNYADETSKLKVEGLNELYAMGNKTSIKTSSIKIYSGSTLLTNNKDYKLMYFKNDRAGTAKLKIIRYKNSKYLETKTLFFDIKPAVPKNIKTESYQTKLKLNWTASKGASYYEIQELDENDNTYNEIDISKTNSYTNTGLESAKKNFMRIRAVYDRNGKKYYSGFKKISAYTNYPKVDILSFKSAKKGKVAVSWTAKENECMGYEVQYSRNNDFKASVVAKTVKGISSDNLSLSLVSGRTYYARVRSYNKIDGEKVYSNYSKTLKVKVK